MESLKLWRKHADAAARSTAICLSAVSNRERRLERLQSLRRRTGCDGTWKEGWGRRSSLERGHQAPAAKLDSTQRRSSPPPPVSTSGMQTQLLYLASTVNPMKSLQRDPVSEWEPSPNPPLYMLDNPPHQLGIAKEAEPTNFWFREHQNLPHHGICHVERYDREIRWVQTRLLSSNGIKYPVCAVQ